MCKVYFGTPGIFQNQKCFFAKFGKSGKIFLLLIKYTLHFAKWKARICSLNYYFSLIQLERFALSKKSIILRNTYLLWKKAKDFLDSINCWKTIETYFGHVVCSLYILSIFQAKDMKSNKVFFIWFSGFEGYFWR